jgi:hypothetical protein
VPGIDIVPDPPQTNMMHLYLRTTGEALARAACRIARDRGVFTWPSSSPGPTPATRVLELTVGDATLAFEPREAAEIIAELVRA